MQIVILPGLDGTGTLLSDVTDILSIQHRVTPVGYPVTLTAYEDLLPTAHAALPQDDFIIVAESFSGPLAIMIGAQKPPHLRGVFFVATFAKTPRKFPKVLPHILRALPLKSYAFAWFAQPILMGTWRSAAFLEAYRQAIEMVPVKTIAGRLEAIRKVDVVGRLSEISVPLMYLWATSDRLVPAKCAQDFQAAQSAIVQIEGPHFVMQADADRVATHILDFISGLD